MAKICPLCSGSSGNSVYISASSGSVLVDAGMSCKSIFESVSAIGGDIARLQAVAITHQHIDHIKGLKAFIKKTGIPVIASHKTLEALILEDKLPASAQTVCIGDKPVCIGDMQIDRFATSHDCDGSSGYVVTLPDGRRVSVCTDLGVVDDVVRAAISGCSVTLIEANHDVEMLRRGVYPPNLKMRILSDKGHLSNTACAAELPSLLQSGTNRFILGHLSLQNNTPNLALAAAKTMLSVSGATMGKDYLLNIAKPGISEAVVI